jgi:hypothetical protein
VTRDCWPRVRALAASLLLLSVFLTPEAVSASQDGSGRLAADLDGKPINLVDVGKWYCEDFSYPAIHCFSRAAELEVRVASVLGTTSLDYVVIYDFTTYSGSYMYVSQNYDILALIGWNDRISSLRSINSQAGHFFVDWFYGGTAWGFCCNSQYSSLGGFDNSFSSVHTG